MEGTRNRNVTLLVLGEEVQHPIAPQDIGVVLDSNRCGLGGAQRVDAQQVGQFAVVDGAGLCDLEEADQLQPVQSLGAGLVPVDLREPGRTRPGRL